VSVLCELISAQSGLTTIQDTLFDADGSRYNGSLIIQWSTFDSAHPGTIVQQGKTVQVVNGNLLVQLAPNNTATPPANIYTVLYQSDGFQQYSESWTVPASTTPLKVSQVRIGIGAGGGGAGGGLTGGTGTVTESSVTNLVSDLNARPIRGPGYGTNAVAVVDQNGQIETVVGNLGDCVFVDGTTGPCSAPVSLPTFVNGEIPNGALDGNNGTFTLANSPSGLSLQLFRNGVLMAAGVDYSLTGSTVQFMSSAVPQASDKLVAHYRIDSGSGNSGSGPTAGPSGAAGVNGCGAVGTKSESAPYQIQASDNGYLLIQSVSGSFSLPVTVPAAGWCVVLLNTSSAAVAVVSNGNNINGVPVNYSLQAANSVFVISDGTGFWTSGAGSSGSGPAGPAGPAGPTGPQGPTGNVGANVEYNTSQTMTSADCPSALKTFTGSSPLTYTLISPVAGCNVAVQNNSSRVLTINVSTNGLTINGQSSDITIPACPAQPSGCPAAVIRSNGSSSWDMSLPASMTTGMSGSVMTREVVIGAGGGSVTVTHNLGTTTPLIGQAITVSGCGNCYAIGSFTPNTFTVTSTQAADLVFPLLAGAAPSGGFSLAVVPVTSSEFQSDNTAVYTVAQTASGGYSGTATLSCASVSASGVTCAFAPASITGSGTSTLTVSASGTATPGAGTFIVSGTDGTTTGNSSPANLAVWAGPVQKWTMNEGTSPMSDSSGHPDNLTNSNVTYTNVSGLLSNTPTYNGSTSGSVAANNSTYNFDGNSPFTVCLWANQTGASGAESAMVSNLTVGSTYAGWELGTNGNPRNAIRFYLIDNYPSNYLVNFYTFMPTTGTAFHYCVAYDGSRTSAGAIGYINGVADTVNSTAGSLSGPATSSTLLNIGTRAGTTSDQFTGGIADVRIFNYQLSAAQVAAIYAAGVK
jgi:hypothetical protein